jgi:oligosaccharide repeat unit polymerase
MRNRIQRAPTRPAQPTAAAAPSRTMSSVALNQSPVFDSERPMPHPVGTALCLLGLFLTGVTLNGKYSSEIARYTAIGSGLSIALSMAFDVRRGFRNLIRADLMAILTLYLLTMLEMLFPQPDFNMLVDAATAQRGAVALLWGFAGLIIGRHLWHPRRHPLGELLARPVPRSWIITLFWGSFFLGYFYMLLSVKFDLVRFVDCLMWERFSQPWSRGQLGDWRALLSELALLLNLIPPLAGIIIARRHRYTKLQVFLVTLAALFTLFAGFAGGTRNVFGSYLVTFLIGYSFAAAREKKNELIVLSVICTTLMLVATFLMLQFRDLGLKNYINGMRLLPSTHEQSVFVDADFYAICRIVELFPKSHDYLRAEIPYLAFIRPIPRALWPGKPIGLSMTIEDVVGVEDMTIAASFVGESYMSGGLFAVFIAALFFGAIMGWWTHLASPGNSDFGVLVYASGFFAAVISMRSLFVLTTALLPTLASVTIGFLLIKKRAQKIADEPPIHAARTVRQ